MNNEENRIVHFKIKCDVCGERSSLDELIDVVCTVNRNDGKGDRNENFKVHENCDGDYSRFCERNNLRIRYWGVNYYQPSDFIQEGYVMGTECDICRRPDKSENLKIINAESWFGGYTNFTVHKVLDNICKGELNEFLEEWEVVWAPD